MTYIYNTQGRSLGHGIRAASERYIPIRGFDCMYYLPRFLIFIVHIIKSSYAQPTSHRCGVSSFRLCPCRRRRPGWWCIIPGMTILHPSLLRMRHVQDRWRLGQVSWRSTHIDRRLVWVVYRWRHIIHWGSVWRLSSIVIVGLSLSGCVLRIDICHFFLGHHPLLALVKGRDGTVGNLLYGSQEASHLS